MNPTMRLFWQRHGLTAMLGLAGVGFLALIGHETGWGQAVRRPLPTATEERRTPDMVVTLPGFALPSLDNAFKETADRPLFTPTRRPTAGNLAANVPVMKKGQFKLSGTSVNNDLTVAFLLETATGKTVRIAKGKEINGMTLAVVDEGRVVLKQGEETEELTLRTAPSPPLPVKVAAPAQVTVPATPAIVAPAAAGGNVGAPTPASVTPPPAKFAAQPPNALVPAPGSSQLPGFVLPPSARPDATAAPAAESPNAAQRRRRVQTSPQ